MKYRVHYDASNFDEDAKDESKTIQANSAQAAAEEFACDEDTGEDWCEAYVVDELGVRHAFKITYHRSIRLAVAKIRWPA